MFTGGACTRWMISLATNSSASMLAKCSRSSMLSEVGVCTIRLLLLTAERACSTYSQRHQQCCFRPFRPPRRSRKQRPTQKCRRARSERAGNSAARRGQEKTTPCGKWSSYIRETRRRKRSITCFPRCREGIIFS